jgi:hypothetical protein
MPNFRFGEQFFFDKKIKKSAVSKNKTKQN